MTALRNYVYFLKFIYFLRGRETNRAFTCWFAFQMSTPAGAGPGQKREPRVNVGLPGGWQGLNHESRHCCPLGFALAGSWSQGQRISIEPRYFPREQHSILTTAPDARPCSLKLLICLLLEFLFSDFMHRNVGSVSSRTVFCAMHGNPWHTENAPKKYLLYA